MRSMKDFIVHLSSLLETSLKAVTSSVTLGIFSALRNLMCQKTTHQGYTTEQKVREEMFYLQIEMIMPCEGKKKVFLFGGRNEGAHTLFIEKEGFLRKLALFHN